MNQKHVTLAACLLAFGLAAQAQDEVSLRIC